MASQLTDLIRRKYPGQYDDMDDIALEKAILTKYPDYKDLSIPLEEPTAPIIPTPEEIPTVPIEEPIPEVEPEPEKGWLSKAWSAISEPLTDIPSRLASSVADYIDEPTLAGSPTGEGGIGDYLRETGTRARGFVSGATEGIGDFVSGLTSPINLATAALTGGQSATAKRGLDTISDLLGYGAKLSGGLTAGHGATEVLDPESTMAERGFGLAEIAGGISPFAMKSKTPFKPELPPGMIEASPGKFVREPKISEVKPKYRLDQETGAGIPIDETGQQIGPAVFPGKQLDPEVAAKSKYARELNKFEEKEPGMAKQVYDLTRGLMSVDAPFGTSAAFRQAAPLIGTKNWFNAWDKSIRAFGSENSYQMSMDKIKQRPLFQPKKIAVGINKDGIMKYKDGPSYAEEVKLATTDLGKISHREEMIRSYLAEKIPIYGKYIRASNRAYTLFLNQSRADQLETLVESAKAIGKDPTKDLVLGRQIADIINDQTGRGKLSTTVAGKQINLEKNSKLLTDTLWSPRLMASRIRMLYPEEYLRADPFVRKEYAKSMARMVGGWGAISSGFALSGLGSVSLDSNSADFGKIRIGNTRIDPGAGFQQYLVFMHRMLPQIETWEKAGIPKNEITSKILSGGGTTSSTTGKFTPFGTGFKPSNRFSTSMDFALSKIHPTLGLGKDVLKATPKEPFNVYDRTLQAVFPMFLTGMVEIYNDDPDLFKTLIGGFGAGMTGLGTQTYEKGDFGKPAITPFLEKATGIPIESQDIQLGR